LGGGKGGRKGGLRPRGLEEGTKKKKKERKGGAAFVSFFVFVRGGEEQRRRSKKIEGKKKKPRALRFSVSTRRVKEGKKRQGLEKGERGKEKERKKSNPPFQRPLPVFDDS